MKYIDVTNITWADAEHTRIVCDVSFEFGVLPYSPAANDSAPHSVEIWNRIMAGDFGPIAEYVHQPSPEGSLGGVLPVIQAGQEGGIL